MGPVRWRRAARRIVVVGLCGAVLAVADPARSTSSGFYHHLGAGTVTDWTGVVGRLTVRDAAVRAGTYDFVAARFMAKHESGGGTAWLEAGWAETGWAGGGRQRVYTYDTNGRAWTFYDRFALTDGDQIWISVHTTRDGVWEAWLWWRDGWHLLTSQRLGTPRAQLEQYVEVHVDGAGTLAVPPIAVDNVQVRDGATSRYWREAEVRTATGGGSGGYCLDWATRFDTWTAGSC